MNPIKKRRIIIISVCIALLTALAGGYLITSIKERVTKRMVGVYQSQEEIVAQQVADSLGKGIADIQRKLEIMALAPEVINSSNRTACNTKLDEYFTTSKHQIGNIGRVNTAGIFDCSLNRALIGSPASALGDYVPRLIADPQHKPVLSQKIKPAGIPGYAAALHVPVYDKTGGFQGTLGGAIYFDQIKDQYLKDIKIGDKGFASLVDDNGDVLYHPNSTFIGKNVRDDEIRKVLEPSDALLKVIENIKNQPAGNIQYKVAGEARLTSFRAFDVPGRQMIAFVTAPASQVDEIIETIRLDGAFIATIGILTLAIGVLTFVMLFGWHKSFELERAKDEFVSITSHQLRTPLTSIRLFAEMLANGQAGALKPKQADYVQKIDISTKRMIALVGDILNISRIELGKVRVNPQPTDLVAYIRSQVDEIQPVAAERGIKIELRAPHNELPQVMVDPVLFGQAMHNLLTNAIRYSPEKTGKIVVAIAKEGTQYHFSVTDNGIGIPKDQQRKIFKRFFRADNAQRTVGDGNGLGLYLIKMIMQVAGGKVWFESKEGHGSTFHITLPETGMRPKRG